MPEHVRRTGLIKTITSSACCAENSDVSADGQRFLTMETLPDGANKIVFVPNWFDELERLVPHSEGR